MGLPLALGLVGAGAGAGILGSAFGGGSGKQVTNLTEISKQQTKKISKSYQTQTTFSPQTTNTTSFNPQINLGGGSTLSKKEATTGSPSQEVSPTASIPTTQTSRQSASQQQSASQSTGLKKLLIAGALAGGGYILYKNKMGDQE